MNLNTSVKKLIGSSALLFASTALISIPLPALASGSIGVGGGVNTKAAYRLGKQLVYQKVVCGGQQANTEYCVPEEQLTNRAASLVASLEARNEENKPGTPDDTVITLLCPGENAGDCAGKPDEQELAHYYLTRRYKLK